MYTPTSNKRKLVSAHFSGEAIKDTAAGLSTSTIARGVFSGSSEPTMAFGKVNDNDSASFSISTLPTPNMHADDRPSTQAIDGQLLHRDLSRTESNQVSSRNFGEASRSSNGNGHRPWARKDDLRQETVSTKDCVLSSPPHSSRTIIEQEKLTKTTSPDRLLQATRQRIDAPATFTFCGTTNLQLFDYAKPRVICFDPVNGRLRSRSRNILLPPGPVREYTSLKRKPLSQPSNEPLPKRRRTDDTSPFETTPRDFANPTSTSLKRTPIAQPSNEPTSKRQRTDDVSPFAKQTTISPDDGESRKIEERIVPSLVRCSVCSTRLTRKQHGGSRYPRCTKKECKTPITPFEQRKLDRVKTNTWSSTHCHARNSRSKGPRMTRKTVIEIKERRHLILCRASSRYRRYGSRADIKDRQAELETLWPILTRFDALPIDTVIEESADLHPSVEPPIVDSTGSVQPASVPSPDPSHLESEIPDTATTTDHVQPTCVLPPVPSSLGRCFVCSTRLTWKQYGGGCLYPRCAKKECKTQITPSDQLKSDRVKSNTWSPTDCHPRNSRSKGPQFTRKQRNNIMAHKHAILCQASSRYRRYGSRAERKGKQAGLESLWPIVAAFDALPIETVIEEPPGLQPSLEPTIVDTVVEDPADLLPSLEPAIVDNADDAQQTSIPSLATSRLEVDDVPFETVVEESADPLPSLEPAIVDTADVLQPISDPSPAPSNLDPTPTESNPLGSIWIVSDDGGRYPTVRLLRRSCRARRKPVRFSPA